MIGPTRRKRQSGSALIEFSISFILIVILALGAVSFGLNAQASLVVTDAAYAGASYGANTSQNSSDTTGMQQAALNAAPAVKNLTATATSFCTCSPGGAQVTCSSACGSDQPLLYVQVVTTASFANPLSCFGLPATFQLKGVSVMPVQ